MAKNLLIVESPSKAKTLKKYLGSDFEILASYGHVRDLVPKSGAVDPENDFAMKYQLVSRNAKHLDAIVAAAKEADVLYLATDPDREGEAISWHLQEILKSKRGLKNLHPKRVVFHEVTKKAVLDAVAHPRELSQTLIDAQQTRRALDYLVGFNLSPLLWKKIRRGLSAGRVQSPALRMICEREQEIREFTAQEYWTVHLDSHKARTKFTAKLTHWQGQKLEQFDIPDEVQQQEIVNALVGQQAHVTKVEKKKRSRNPAAPFTTSTMQQEAVRKLGMTTDRTMRTAQQLYEGVDVGQGAVGLITYMRTDSVSLSDDAVIEIRHYIDNKIGSEYLPSAPKIYKTKSKNAQEAHEAIRPTSVYRTPEAVKPFLTADQFRLYQMIWQRAVACQMAPARFDTTSVDIVVGKGIFRVTGQVQTFAGFLSVYEEGVDDSEDEENTKKLPELHEGDNLPVDRIFGEQHFTQPPPRYSEASLVKALEEYGIGRPSTYASIISTLKEREYVTLEQKRFLPTDTGEVVNKFLTEHFGQYVDYNFTARLENQLDDIAGGKREWRPVMQQFWKGFDKEIKAKEDIPRAELTAENLDEICPKCGVNQLQIKFGKRGRFIACTGYPECDYTRNVNETAEEAAKAAEEPTIVEGRSCPKCQGQLVYKRGRYGKFIGCANYPKCKYIEPLEKPKDTGIECPKCHKGSLIERKSRYGKLFYSCNTYPDCDYAVWNPPINEQCPQCHWPILTIKTTKRRGTEKVCPQKECGYTEQIEPPAPKE
ncbi:MULTISPECIES: type I DNA topoisomerase [Snodgrassella]|uniref:type I DNA topoisomerase n=1 Tax=Snodgrassella TaxID=1193515 RepID=UPI0008158584|nr:MULTISPECIES: type I DNA topoisomerase [Snodgrassella]MCO6513552.1 type I DNA topoisomerase [Snodgrassella sp.]MCO6517955.1 type I DNA topoisomerase [Snodgrassella sp.]MCO6520622.1 type I DNA topoisomerase [Snodgrassella sp.]WMY92139.1 type I DNA topoisomerase [Snodgrassella communis]SCC06500.1 DNA topoisomerase-1 [Snodgrassella sp. R-53583]